MVHFVSKAIIGLALLALQASAVPTDKRDNSTNVITLADIQNALPVIPPVTNPADKAIGGIADNSTVLATNPDIQAKVNEAVTLVPQLLSNDSVPATTKQRRGLSKRNNVSGFLTRPIPVARKRAQLT